MKPLITVPLTSEDSAILARVWVRNDALWHALVYPHLYGGNQDRRDAELMLLGQSNRWRFLAWRPGTVWEEGVLLRGPPLGEFA